MPFGFVTTYPRSSVLSPKASANPDVGREKPMARNTFWATISTGASVVSSAFIRPVAASGVHFNRAKRPPPNGALLIRQKFLGHQPPQALAAFFLRR